jgi:hypothetical protein
LEWVRDGSVLFEGPRIPHRAVPVSAADRAAFRRERAARPAGGLRELSSRGASPAPAPEAVRRMEVTYPDEMFPAQHPPLESEGVRLAPNGDVWVPMSAPAARSRRVVNVLRADGTLRGALELPPEREFVAVDRSGVYLARRDPDGLLWLERYAVR